MQESGQFLSVSETRNSPIRELMDKPLGYVTEKINRAFPELHPNHLNVLGAVGVGVGSILAANRSGDNPTCDKILTISSAITIAASSLTDAFDGKLARLLASKGKNIDFSSGQIKDTVSDRVQETALGLSRMISAKKRGDKIGQTLAFITTITNSLPSYARSLAEKRGKPVPETGNSIYGLLGSRVGRGVMGSIATVFPEIQDVPIQVISDAMMASANIINTIDRLGIANDSNIKTILPDKTQKEAKIRSKALGLCVLGAGVAAVLTYHHLNKEDPKVIHSSDR